jgi:hypothetical protein
MSSILSEEILDQDEEVSKKLEEEKITEVVEVIESEVDLTELTEKLGELSPKDLARLLSKVVKDKKLEQPKVVKTEIVLTQISEDNHEKGLEIGLKGVQLLTFSLSTFNITLSIIIDERGHTTITHLNNVELKIPVKI